MTIQLVTGQTYQIVFWAQNENAPYSFNQAEKKIEVSYPTDNNDENLDAFYVKKIITVDAANLGQTAELKRPFCQVNIATSDLLKANQLGSYPTTSKVKFTNVPNVLNVIDGTVSGQDEVEFNETNKPEGKIAVNGTEYDYLSMTYFLAPTEGDMLNTVTMTVNDLVDGVRSYSNIPVKRNYKTNIVGDLLTSKTNWNVFITPDFIDEMWMGNAEPVAPNPGTTTAYTVSSPAQLAGIAQMVSEGETFKGKTITLSSDIDLCDMPWTPIGNSTTKFQGTFDGGGHTIKNLKVDTPSNSNVGLFGFTTDAKISNLTVENAQLKGYLNVGVVAGSPYTCQYENITVKGLIKIDGFSYVGGAFGKNAYANLTKVVVEAEPGSYVKAESGAYRTYIGGLVGFMGEGNITVSDCHTNIDVIGSTCDVGGLVGIAHYSNTFLKCSSSSNIKVTAGVTGNTDGWEVGGIAGVWHNQSGKKVTFKNCEFTGTIQLIDKNGVDRSSEVQDYKITHTPYSASDTGELWIDDVKVAGGV